MNRPFRFGAIFGAPYTAVHFVELSRRLEGEGFSTLLAADHYAPNPTACGPVLTAAAGVKTTLRVGSYVYNNDFRHPVLLAKEAATIDMLSGGRMELGIGAGYYEEEYGAVGLAFDPPGMRARGVSRRPSTSSDRCSTAAQSTSRASTIVFRGSTPCRPRCNGHFRC